MSVVNNNAALSFVRSARFRIGEAFAHPKTTVQVCQKKCHVSETNPKSGQHLMVALELTISRTYLIFEKIYKLNTTGNLICLLL